MSLIAGIERLARGPMSWRLRLSLAGACLGGLPLWQDEWLAALVATVAGLLVVGTWAWGTGSGRTVGVTVGAVLVASLAAVFAVSQWPRGLISPPWYDWFLGWLLIGGGCIAALVVDWMVHASNGLVRIGATTVPARQWVIAVTAVVTAPLVLICCTIVAVLDDNDGALRFAARDSEILPLPPTLRLISAGPCVRGGSAGSCRAKFVVKAADGATRAVTVVRLVDHLRRLGWPLQPAHSAYFGCRETGGTLPWTSHCLVLETDPVPSGPLTDAEAVIISISNMG